MLRDNPKTTCETTGRQPRVNAALQRLSYNNDVLCDTLQALVERLHTVLGPEMPPTPHAGAEKAPVSCDMEQFVENQTEMVCARIRTLQTLLDRLEI